MSAGPVFYCHSGHPLEFAGIGGDDDESPGARLAGDKQVVATDRQTHRCQLGAETSRFARIIEVEVEHREGQRVDLREVVLDPGRAVRAPVELVEYHRRYRDVTWRLPAQPLRYGAIGIAQHGNDRVGVEREGHAASNSARGCGGG